MKATFQNFLFFSLLLLSFGADAQVRLRNAKSLRESYGLNEFRSKNLEAMKIAVLDNDFEGFEQNKNSLPESAEYIAGPLEGAKNAEISGHGLLMAQSIWGLTGMRKNGPKFYLIQSNGLTNLRAAINKAIELDVDMILYAATWDTAGNFDGKGFINSEVSKATDAGIAWINAAGNDHGSVYNGKIRFDSTTGWLRNPGANNNFKFRVKYTNTPVKLTLSWNDFKDHENHQTEKDLDWELKNWKGEVIALRNFKQGSSTRCKDEPTYSRGERTPSLHPREQDTVVLNEGLYYLRVYDCSGNFTNTDKVRLHIQNSKGDGVEFYQAQNSYEIMPPADHAKVLSIGDLSPISSIGPTQDERIKPDFRMPVSSLEMSDGRHVQGGSSAAAAIFAGIYAVLWGEDSRITPERLLKTHQGNLFWEQNESPQGTGPVWRTPDIYEFRAMLRH